ncbi:hypothetical protein [Superficieibacter sp. HKU1]|uniref:hypothetical protein n=1 Tax=Superficieibacter sp. HKU1 TaxID=3031919 RepID=UPI0023E1C275|nr:hypothetical protein [Superficieibacter sp. HKU1]WES70102.1 hypothetical protein P0H77_09045 [Superficieibacter sp. HKU1]
MMSLKSVFLLAGMFLLTGCLVTNMDSSNYKFVDYVQTFQKSTTIGHTDRAQRKTDLYSCGVDKNTNLDDGSWSAANAKPGDTLQTVVARRKKIERCMEGKGYVVFGYEACGPVKAPTGKCN